MNIKNRIISGILCASMTLSLSLAFAAPDDNEIQSYFYQISKGFSTIEDAKLDEPGIGKSLMEEYDCTEDEAKKYIEQFYNTYFDKDGKKIEPGEDNGDDDGKKEDNSNTEEITKPKASEEDTINYKVLCDLGLIDTDDLETALDLSADCTRGDFAKMIARILSNKYGLDGISPIYMFDDVAEEDALYPYLAACINENVVWGYGDGYYKPEQSVTLEEACAITVRSMGYQKEMEFRGNEITYYYKAKEIGLLKGIDAKVGETVTNAESIKLVYNALLSNIYTVLYDDGNATYFEGKPMIEQYMDMSWLDGLMTANDKTSVYSREDKLGKNEIMVDGVTYSTDDGKNLGQYLGRYVRIFYSLEESGVCAAVKPSSVKNKELFIDGGLIDRYEDGKLYYFENEESEKEKNVNITKDMHIIFNGAAISETYNPLIFTPQFGDIRFVGNGSGNDYDIVIINSYVPYLFNGTGSADPALRDNFEVQPTIKIDGDKTFEFIKDGEECTASEIVSDNVIMVATDKVKFVENGSKWYCLADADNSDYVTVIQNTQKLSGTVESVIGNGEKYKIGGNVYEISEYMQSMNFCKINDKYFSYPLVGSTIDATLDKDGKIISLKITVYDGKLQYAYLKSAKIVDSVDENSGEEAALFKVFTQNGEHLKLYGADKIKVFNLWDDGVSKVDETTYYAKKMDYTKLFNYFGGSIEKKLIKYALNSDGRISTLYLPESQYMSVKLGTDLNFYRGKGILSKYYSNSNRENIPQTWYYWSGAELVFIVPNDMDDTDSFKMGKISSIQDGGSIDLYDANEGGTPKVIVNTLKKVSNTGDGIHIWSSTIGILTEDVSESYDPKTDSIVLSMPVYTRSGGNFQKAKLKKCTYTITNVDMTTYKFTEEKDGDDMSMSEIPIKDLKKGDIVVLTDLNNDLVLEGCGIKARAERYIQEDGSLYIGSFYGGFRKMTQFSTAANLSTHGKVIKRSGNTLYIDDHTEYIRKYGVSANDEDGSVYIYDLKNGKIYPAVMADIQVGDYVMVFYGTISFVCVVRN